MRIPITKPVLDGDDRRAILEPLDSGWLVQGPQVAAFERAFAAYAGAEHAVAVSSCTTALHLALVAAGVGSAGGGSPDDEVVVPSFTYVASANAVVHAGARPVFCDVADDFNTTAALMERAVGPRTRALMPVHLFGLAVEIEPVLALAREKGLAVIEDAACGLGARRAGRHCGTWGLAGCFSFHPRKAITTGEGGMLTTADGGIAAAVRSLRDHGAAVSDRDRHEAGTVKMPAFARVGFNFRMTDLQGALGLSQLAKADRILAARRARAARYDALLAGLPLRTPVIPPGATHAYQSYVVLLDDERRRDPVMEALAKEGIQTRPGTHAVHMLEAYRRSHGHAPEDFPGARRADAASLSLPLYASMTDAEQDEVVAALGRLL